jgi:DNA topoisomerase-3
MTAIITDRANIAKQIASVLDMDITTENEGYFQGHGFTLVWTSGELISLSPPEDYGKNNLGKGDLPFIPETFSHTVRKRKTAKGTAVADRTAVKQLNIIKKVFDECESIIAATDSGEAGELLFRRIYTYLECKKPFRRLWISSLTVKAIREGFKNLKESSLYDNLHAAADCRAKADYLAGFNASSALGLATGLAAHPLDRIQTPTLTMICKRFMEHRKFVSTRCFEHCITIEKDRQFRQFRFQGTTKNRRKAEKIHEHLKAFRTAQITKVETCTAIQPAPQLYNPAALQKDANIRYGFPAAKTMEIMRKLYEEKLISHPLTESCHIPEDVFETLPKIIRQTAAYCNRTDRLYATGMENLNRRNVMEKNTQPAGHHALIPTGIYPGYLPKEGKAIYEMIASRTLEAFAPDCQKEVSIVEAALGNLVFISKKTRIITPGWRSILDREDSREEGEAEENDVFPVLAEGESVRISGYSLLTKKILPPPLYTEASLLQAMEKAGMGTSATRASTIETLFSCGYIKRQGQNPVPAEKGMVIHNHIKDMRIADPEMAGGWEKTLTGISRGKQNADTFITTFKIFTKQVTEEILSLNRTKDFKLRLGCSKPCRKKEG